MPRAITSDIPRKLTIVSAPRGLPSLEAVHQGVRFFLSEDPDLRFPWHLGSGHRNAHHDRRYQPKQAHFAGNSNWGIKGIN